MADGTRIAAVMPAQEFDIPSNAPVRARFLNSTAIHSSRPSPAHPQVVEAPVKRISTLDGWRGIAILLVLFDHIQDSLLYGYIRPWTQTGQHGVTIFFVLSGFLITTKLMEGPIDLKRFYIRRFFRLMPAAWTYLAFLLLVDWLTGAHFISLMGVSSCVLFYRNFIGDAAGRVTGHFWSLSLEEQFYLVWPCILLLAGMRRSRWIAAIGAIGCAAFRWAFWTRYDSNLLNGQTQVRADALLIGCLLAMLLADSRVRVEASRCFGILALPACGALLFSIARFHWLPPLFESASIAVLIATTTLNSATWFARLLAFRPVVWLGTVSYSLYLWQEFFMPFRRPWVLCLLMPLFGLASYYLIERPTTRFGRRLTSPSIAKETAGNASAHPELRTPWNDIPAESNPCAELN